MAGNVLSKNLPDHLQTAGIEVHLLGQIHLPGNIAVDFSMGGQVAAIGKIETKIPHLDIKLFPAVKKIVEEPHEKFVMVALQHGPSYSLFVGIAGF